MTISDRAKRLRVSILEIAYQSQDGNLQSAFSSVEILEVLYNSVLRFSPQSIHDPDRDCFFLSKGQATFALLAILADKGFISPKELTDVGNIHSKIGMQVDRTKMPCFENSAGSLGHGFPLSVGMAWSKKIQHNEGRVFTLVGDGEMNEGTMWEAALFASSENLNNLTIIVDDNNSINQMLQIGDLGKKLSAFGFQVFDVNGHNEDDLDRVLHFVSDRPQAIIAHTKRGYGSNTLMTDKSWFHRAPSFNEMQMLKDEVMTFVFDNSSRD